MDQCKPLVIGPPLTVLPPRERLVAAGQGLTLVHFSAQRYHFLGDRGCI